MAEPPEIRVGTAEREQALNVLGEHFAAGRLTLSEFDERSAVVAKATTRGELDTVFSDLPAPGSDAPAKASNAKPTTEKEGRDWRDIATALTPIVALVLFFVFKTWLFFLLIPAVWIILGADRKRQRGC